MVYLSEMQVAARLAVSVQTVRRWRYSNYGPSFVKIGRTVRYSEAALSEFMDGLPKGGKSHE